MLLQPDKKLIVVCVVIDPGLKSIFHPFYAGRLMQSKTTAVTPGKIPELLQPVRMGSQSGIVVLDRLPVDFLQLPACQHGTDGHLPDRSHALSDEVCRILLYFPFLEQVLQFLPALLIQPHSKLLPA